MISIQIVFTGRRYQTAADLPSQLDLPEAATVDDALNALKNQLDDSELPPSCLVAVAGDHLGTLENHTERTLKDGDELVLIAPVAGG